MSTQKGRRGEQAAAKHLQSLGHSIVCLNWKTRRCEIDIVSAHGGVVYFTEVKLRSSEAWGSGEEYVTNRKVSQMHFAAEMWLYENNWEGESQLQVMSVDANGDITLFKV